MSVVLQIKLDVLLQSACVPAMKVMQDQCPAISPAFLKFLSGKTLSRMVIQ